MTYTLVIRKQFSVCIDGKVGLLGQEFRHYVKESTILSVYHGVGWIKIEEWV